jgi:hypothetical protein
MREIIYLQAGSLSNYTGTHFWNTQESYLTYDEEEISVVDQQVSFEEHLTGQVRSHPLPLRSASPE